MKSIKIGADCAVKHAEHEMVAIGDRRDHTAAEALARGADDWRLADQRRAGARNVITAQAHFIAPIDGGLLTFRVVPDGGVFRLQPPGDRRVVPLVGAAYRLLYTEARRPARSGVPKRCASTKSGAVGRRWRTSCCPSCTNAECRACISTRCGAAAGRGHHLVWAAGALRSRWWRWASELASPHPSALARTRPPRRERVGGRTHPVLAMARSSR